MKNRDLVKYYLNSPSSYVSRYNDLYAQIDFNENDAPYGLYSNGGHGETLLRRLDGMQRVSSHKLDKAVDRLKSDIELMQEYLDSKNAEPVVDEPVVDTPVNDEPVANEPAATMAEMPEVNLHQMRVMLDHMGCHYDEHGSVTSMVSTFENFFKFDNTAFTKAFKVVVDKEIDSPAVVGKSTADLAKLEQVALNKVHSNTALVLNEEMDKLKDKTIKSIKSEAQSSVNEKLQTLSVEAKQIAIDAIEEASKKFRKVEIKVNDNAPKQIDGVLPKEFNRLCELAANRLNVLMVGPAGSGKTFLASKIAEALDLDFSSQSCSAGMSESQLTGWLLPIGDSGAFTYVPSEFVRIYENGGVFLLDELDASDPNVLIFINQAIANGSFTLPQRFNNPVIKRHKDFVCVGAANTYGSGADAMYHGRNALDAATLDRFKMGTVTIDYSADVEEAIIDSEVLEWGRSVRAAIEQHNLRRIMSTRVMKDATQMKRGSGWTLDQIKEAYFSDWSNEEKLIIGI